MKFFSTILKNGLRVVGEQRPGAASSALGFFVKTGARDETAEISGVSHFLEHMMFKGTQTRSALDINYQLGAMGAQANAYTSEEKTVYYAGILPEYLPKALELFSDMLRPKLDEEEFEVEKKVILEEIALYHDRPTHVLFEAALQTYFGQHPAGSSVLGSLQSVGDLTRTQMKTYFDARYTPKNMLLAVSGSFDWDDFLKQADTLCGSWIGEDVSRPLPAHVPIEQRKELTKENMQRAHICLLTPGPSNSDADRYAAQVLSNILGDGSGSKVFWELVDKGLVDSASLDNEELDGTGMFVAYASASPENLDQVESSLRAIMKKPLDFSDADLERAISKIGTRLVLQGESSMRRLMSVGIDWLERGEYYNVEQEYLLVRGVNRKSIETLVERFNFEPMTAVAMRPTE